MYKFLLGILILMVIILNNTSSSYAVFSDNSAIDGNYISVGDMNNLTSNNKITSEPPVSYVNAPNSY